MIHPPLATFVHRLGIALMLFSCVMLAASSVAAQAETEEPPSFQWVVAPALGSSFLTATVDANMQVLTLNAGVRAGLRLTRWGFFLHTEWAAWQTPTGGGNYTQMALNLGLGVEYVYHDARVRTSLAAGTSTLLRSNELDSAGTTGFFADLRPAGLRWDRGQVWGIDPIHLTILIPVLGGIPLVDFQFRTTVSVEL